MAEGFDDLENFDMNDLAVLYPEYSDVDVTDLDQEYYNLISVKENILKKKGYKYLRNIKNIDER